MASRHLGPESPRPFSVISEGHVRRHVDIPFIPEFERYSFGEQYDNKMCELIHKYLELDTDDRLCYVGESRGSLVPMVQDRFCLMEPVTTVLPGHIHYEESPNHHMLPIKVANVGAEDYFRRLTEGQRVEGLYPFDKILLKDGVRYMDDAKQTFSNIMNVMNDFGRLLIIQRPGPMNTLPLFSDAKDRLNEHEEPYLNTIKDLQALKYDVQWEIECLQIRMSKSKWYGMLKERYPSQMEMVSNHEVTAGLRELSEGILKYSGDEVEFVDRLLFVTVTKPILNQKMPSIMKYGFPTHAVEPLAKPSELKMTYKMEVTPDIKHYVRQRERLQQKSSQQHGLSSGW